MTSISGISSTAALSPFTRVQAVLNKEVSAGKISSTDQSALTSAIGDVSAALTPGAKTQTGSMKDQVDGAIDSEVSSGKLSSDQAAELKGLFAKAHGHMHHVSASSDNSAALASLLGTSTSATPAATTSSSTSSTSSSASDGITSVASGASSVIDGLAHFVNGVRTAIQKNGLYGAAGGPAGVVGSLLVNKLA